MRRLITGASAAAMLVALAVGTPASAVDDCNPDGPPPQPQGGNEIQIPAARPTINHELFIRALFNDSRPYVDGSMRITVQQPGGGQVTYNPDDNNFKPAQIGGHVATATATFIGCTRSADPPDYVTDSAGPTSFNVADELDQTIYVKALVRRREGDVTLQANIECDSTTGPTEPVTFTMYYETGTRRPSHVSPHLHATSFGGCGGRTSKDTSAHKTKRLYRLEVDGGGNAQLTVIRPQRMRVLIEMSMGPRIVAAVRARFSKAKRGEAVKPDGECTGFGKGCTHFKTTFLN
jgi:hypothetical protein